MNAWESNYKSKQGNIGLGQAIAYYTYLGIPISLPLNDTQKYDLIIDRDNRLYRVSVKTTRFMEYGNYKVALKNSGGSSGKSVIRNFDNTSCDLVFVYTKDGDMYEIPSDEIKVKTMITLNDDYEKFKVNYLE